MRSRWFALVVGLAVLASTPAAAEDAASLTARATKLYRAKSYDEACPSSSG